MMVHFIKDCKLLQLAEKDFDQTGVFLLSIENRVWNVDEEDGASGVEGWFYFL